MVNIFFHNQFLMAILGVDILVFVGTLFKIVEGIDFGFKNATSIPRGVFILMLSTFFLFVPITGIHCFAFTSETINLDFLLSILGGEDAFNSAYQMFMLITYLFMGNIGIAALGYIFKLIGNIRRY